MQKIGLTAVVLWLCVLCGCAGQKKEERRLETTPVLTFELALSLVDQEREATFSAVLAKVKEGVSAGRYAVFPGSGIETGGYLLENFDAKNYLNILGELRENESVWVVMKGKFRAFSAEYATKPGRDPVAIVFDFKIISSNKGATPIWTRHNYPSK